MSSSSPARRIWIDGKLVPWDEARVHVLSHSHQRGSLIFDYMGVHETPRGPAVFRLSEHVTRFQRSTALVGLRLAHGTDAIRAAILATVRANPGASAVKISAYLPSIEVDVVPADDRVEVAIAAYDPHADVLERKAAPPPARRPEARLHLERERLKVQAESIPPEAKVAAHYLGPMMSKWEARRAGFDEVLLIDAKGHLAEGPTTNFFLVDRDAALVTPPSGAILHGVTRSSVIEIAKHEGRSVREEPIAPDALFEAEEVFLTGTSAGIWPVGSIDGEPVGGGRRGPVTQALQRRFEAITTGRDADFSHWLTWVDED